MQSKFNLYSLGIRFDNLLSSLIPYSILTTICFLGMLLYAQFIPNTPQLVQLWKTLYPYAILVVPISIIQELFFRSYLVSKLKQYSKKPLYPILISATIFALAHLIFPYPEIILPGAFLMGIAFGFTYYYYPNLLFASLAHIALNYFLLPTCFFQLIHC